MVNTRATQAQKNWIYNKLKNTAPMAVYWKRISPGNFNQVYQDVPMSNLNNWYRNNRPPNQRNIRAVAKEMKMIKAVWGQLGMYADGRYTDPNPFVKRCLGVSKTPA